MRDTLQRLVRRQAGFTLTELAIAMLVVGILAAIAIPSFLGVRNNAFDREAQAAVDAALDAASQHYLNNGDFTNSTNANCNLAASEVLAADLNRLDPNYEYLKGDEESDNPRRVSIQAAVTWNAADESLGCQAFYAAALSRSGTCWVGRVTVEGKFLRVHAGGNTPIVVNTGTNNTTNDATEEVPTLKVNGRAYAGLISVSPAADASFEAADDDNTLDVTQDRCNANDQAVQTGVNEALGADPNAYYESWRTVILADSEDDD